MNTKEALDLIRADNNYRVLQRLQEKKAYNEDEPVTLNIAVDDRGEAVKLGAFLVVAMRR